jgi:hypothetical protein
VKRSRSLLAWPVFVALLAVSSVGMAHAQSVRVALRDSVTGAPVIGALVSAVDSIGQVRTDGLTNDSGVVSLRVPQAGIWSLGVRRIGVRPLRISSVQIDSGSIVLLTLNVSGIRQQLSTVRVTADAGTCGRAPTGEDRMAALWERISFALRASTLSRADSAASGPLVIAEWLRVLSDHLIEKDAHLTRSGYGAGRPYSAVNSDTLAAYGYVRREPNGDMWYFAPDEVVLLSDAFLATHCFSTPKKDEDPSLAELRFRPVSGRNVADVAGTAFVDTLTGELRRIEFRFVAPRSLIPADAKYAGGDVALLRLNSGQWIVTSWAIRMPLFELTGRPTRLVVRGYREVGGTVDPIETKPPD